MAKSAELLAFVRRASTSATAARALAHTIHTTKGMKSGPNQDTAGIGTSTNPDFINDPKSYLSQFIENNRGKFAKKYPDSGSTFSLAAVINNGSKKKLLCVASFGDSPVAACIKGRDGESVSILLNQEHRFSDPEILPHFPEATEDLNGKIRCDGLVVPCIGHGRIKELAKVNPRINVYDLSQLAPTARLLGIRSPVASVKLVVASDGLYECIPDSVSFGVQPITVTHTTKIKDDRPVFSTSHPNDNELSGIVDGEEKLAERLAEVARDNRSMDDISVVCLDIDPASLAQASSSKEATVAFILDGNGHEGHEVSAELARMICRELELQPIANLALSLPHDIAKDDPELSPKTKEMQPLKDGKQQGVITQSS
jgi:serine/threonine protein phosphatase PrpC